MCSQPMSMLKFLHVYYYSFRIQWVFMHIWLYISVVSVKYTGNNIVIIVKLGTGHYLSRGGGAGAI